MHMHVGKIYARQNHLKAKNSYRTSDVFARGRVLASRVVWWVLLLRKRVWVLLASALATTDNRTGTRHITVRKKDVSYADAKYSAKGHPLPSFQAQARQQGSRLEVSHLLLPAVERKSLVSVGVHLHEGIPLLEEAEQHLAHAGPALRNSLRQLGLGGTLAVTHRLQRVFEQDLAKATF